MVSAVGNSPSVLALSQAQSQSNSSASGLTKQVYGETGATECASGGLAAGALIGRAFAAP